MIRVWLGKNSIWLGKRIREQCNPIANILAKDKHPRNKSDRYPIFLNHSNSSDKDIKRCFCSKKHKITICKQFKAKPFVGQKQFVEMENCVGTVYLKSIKKISIKKSVAEWIAKKYQTLLLEDTHTKFDGVHQSDNFSKHFNTNKTFLYIKPVTTGTSVKCDLRPETFDGTRGRRPGTHLIDGTRDAGPQRWDPRPGALKVGPEIRDPDYIFILKDQ